MGDRRIAEIRTRDGSIYFYTHWGGYHLPNEAFNAIMAAKPRWDDESYATRIIVDQLLAPYRDQALGAGLLLRPQAEDAYNYDKPSVIINLASRTLVVIDGDNSTTTQFGEQPEKLEE